MASIQRIAIKDIALDDDRRVGGKGALETLKASIEKVGLINPITVRKSKEGNFLYTIIAGRRRVEAATLLNWLEIDALVYETDEATDDSYFTQSHIYQRMKLCNLIDDAREIFRNGQIKISTAAKIASLPKQVQKEIVSALKKELQWAGDHEKTIDRVIGQMMRMPLDFPCEACEQCTAKRTHYGNAALFPEYHDRSDYCMDSRCYEKNIRGFYQKTVSEFLKNWSDAKTVYIYEEDKEKAEYLRSILEKKPLIDAIPVHVYHESFEDCSTIRILDEDETDAVYSSSKEVLKQRDIIPVLYPQYGMYQEPVFYIAVDEETYERLFPDTPYETMQEEINREVDTDNCSTESDTDTQETYSDNGAYSAFGAEQAAEEAVDARDWQTLTPSQQTEVIKQALLEYFRLEAGNVRHPFFYSSAFRHILEERIHFPETFEIITGVSVQDFYQQKEYKDLTYQQLLELYVYRDMIDRGQIPFYRSIVADGVPILKEMGLDSDTWRTLYQNARYHFLQERANASPKETKQEQAEKKTAATAGTSA